MLRTTALALSVVTASASFDCTITVSDGDPMDMSHLWYNEVADYKDASGKYSLNLCGKLLDQKCTNATLCENGLTILEDDDTFTDVSVMDNNAGYQLTWTSEDDTFVSLNLHCGKRDTIMTAINNTDDFSFDLQAGWGACPCYDTYDDIDANYTSTVVEYGSPEAIELSCDSNDDVPVINVFRLQSSPEEKGFSVTTTTRESGTGKDIPHAELGTNDEQVMCFNAFLTKSDPITLESADSRVVISCLDPDSNCKIFTEIEYDCVTPVAPTHAPTTTPPTSPTPDPNPPSAPTPGGTSGGGGGDGGGDPALVWGIIITVVVALFILICILRYRNRAKAANAQLLESVYTYEDGDYLPPSQYETLN